LTTSTVTPHEPELMSVGPDEVVVTFTTTDPAAVATRVGDHEVVTDGPYHVAHVTGLEPDTEYPLAVEGAPAGRWLPDAVRTLARPAGRLLATIATANDVHFGETECGRTGDPATDAIGPILSVGPGEDPYPLVMSRAAVAEMHAITPDAVVVKGDLTDTGRPEEYAEFLSVYGAFGDRLHHVRGNHDAMRDPTLATCDTPYAVELGHVTLAVLDSTLPGRVGGALGPTQRAWLDDLAASSTTPVMVFAHHPLWDLDARHPVDPNYVIAHDDSAVVLDIVARRENIVGFFAGHTHTNRVIRRGRARDVPLVEVACAKDYPGAWAEYRCYEGGYTQVMRRTSAPDALAWSERCRHMIQGIYRDLVLGSIRSRCFTERY
jgi:predicted phosphodiesterase